MRVALVCPYSMTMPGGVQTQVLGLSRSLRALGHDARVLAPVDGPPPDLDIVPLGPSVPLAANGSVAPVAPDPRCAARTRHALADGDFDVVHVHEPFAPGPTLVALVIAEAPIVGTFHRHGGSPVYTVLRPLARWTAGRLDARCAVSEEARATAHQALGGDYVLIPNGVQVEAFQAAPSWPTTGPTVLFLGRHEPRKGLGVLLDAFDRLPADTRLWVAGEGSETAALRRRTAGETRIEWLGRLSEAEKASRLRGADVCAAPSLYGESFGVVLLEAMAAGTATVATDLTGYRLVARPGVDALLVPPGDAASLAGALGRVLAEPGLATALAAAGRSRVAEFSLSAAATRYAALYESLLASGAGGRSHVAQLRPGNLLHAALARGSHPRGPQAGGRTGSPGSGRAARLGRRRGEEGGTPVGEGPVAAGVGGPASRGAHGER